MCVATPGRGADAAEAPAAPGEEGDDAGAQPESTRARPAARVRRVVERWGRRIEKTRWNGKVREEEGAEKCKVSPFTPGSTPPGLHLASPGGDMHM
jgi:hypothetical protein